MVKAVMELQGFPRLVGALISFNLSERIIEHILRSRGLKSKRWQVHRRNLTGMSGIRCGQLECAAAEAQCFGKLNKLNNRPT